VRVQTAYPPVFEDWLLHVLLPLVAYAVLVLSALAARAYTAEVLFVVGAATLLLLFIGIHNAWDSIFYRVFARRRDTKAEPDSDQTAENNKR
jgi:hypothetical protein